MSNSPSVARPRPRPTPAASARARAEAAAPVQAEPVQAAPAPVSDAQTVELPVAGRLPVSELLYDRAGAASPFGDDVQFPLPAGALAYRHPTG